MKETFKTSHLPLTLTKLEKSAAENNCEKGWIYGSKVVLHAEQLGMVLVLHSIELQVIDLCSQMQCMLIACTLYWKQYSILHARKC